MRELVERPREPRTSRYYWEREHAPGEKFIPYFWQEFTSQVMIFFLLLGIMGGLALLFPGGLDAPASPIVTPADTKPEWYYLSLYQLLRITSEQIGLIVPAVILVSMVLLPFVDRSAERNPLRKPVTTTIALVLVVGTVVLTVWGAVVK